MEKFPMEEIIQEALSKGIEMHTAGEYDLASQLYESVIKLQPDHADANHNMGVLKLITGQHLEGLRFLQVALQANASCAEFWLSYIKALIALERMDEAAKIISQAEQNGVESEELSGFFQQLKSSTESGRIVSAEENTPSQTKSNPLGSLKLNQALRLAKKKTKEGNEEEAKRIYNDILAKFPKNKQALQKLSTLNELPQELLNQLIDLYNKGQLHAAVEQAEANLEKYPEAFMAWNILGMAHLGLGKVSQAVQAFKRVTEANPSFGDGYRNLGVALESENKLDEALAAYEKALKIKPHNAEVYRNMGNGLLAQGKLDDAINAFKKAVSIRPDYAEAYNSMGNALKDQRNPDEAIEAYNKALSLNPNCANTYNNMGLTLHDQGKLEKAIEAYNKALSIKTDYAEAFNNKGNVLKQQGELEGAIEAYKKALSIRPDYAGVYNNIGNALLEQRKPTEALRAYKEALSLEPSFAEVYCNMSNPLRIQGRYEEALNACEKALFLKPDHPQSYCNKGNIFIDQGKSDDAISSYDKALALEPDNADAHNNMGSALEYQGRIEEAIVSYETAISLKHNFADAHYNLSHALMNYGRLKEGLDEYEWRWKTMKHRPNKRHFSQPQWDGKQSLEGKRILLWSEQGVGDTIIWSSCLPIIASKAAECILECQEKLVPVLARSFPKVRVNSVNTSLDFNRNDFDVHLPMGSLYRCCLPLLAKDSQTNAFLIPDPTLVVSWKKRLKCLGQGPYVGISWKSSKITPARQQNYAPISEWRSLLTIPDITFVNLQNSDFKNDLNIVEEEFGVTVHNFVDLDHFNDLENVAALSAALDAVVSTHNSVPLISAGVGTVTRLANWKQSPWNNVLRNPIGPSVKIYQRNTWEPWANTIKIIAGNMFPKQNS